MLGECVREKEEWRWGKEKGREEREKEENE